MFYSLFKIKKGDVVSIVGAGGKTSMMLHLAEELENEGIRTLVSTTTKLAAGEVLKDYNFLVNIEGDKALAPKLSELKSKMKSYDITLLEADGSARKPLKGWADHEPVIPVFTTVTIGVLDISTVGKSPEIHRPELFKELAGSLGPITVEMLAEVVNKPLGLFKNSDRQRKILYLAKTESEKDMENAQKLAGMIEKDMMIFMGSVRDRYIEEIC